MGRKLFFALAVACALFGVRILFSSPPDQVGIENQKIHKKNKKLFEKIVKNTSGEGYFTNISKIGEEALKERLDLSPYHYRKHPTTDELCFVAVPLWEGKTRGDVTYFLYIWPSKNKALKWNQNDYYASNIHSHPIPCAFTVLQGTITEYSFENKEGKWVQNKGNKALSKGESEIDLKNSPFIHQMVNEGDGRAITLHAYGRKTAKEVIESFREEQQKHTFFLN